MVKRKAPDDVERRAAHYKALGRAAAKAEKLALAAAMRGANKSETHKARIARQETSRSALRARLNEITRSPSPRGAELLQRMADNPDVPAEIRAEASGIILRWASGDLSDVTYRRKPRDPAKKAFRP